MWRVFQLNAVAAKRIDNPKGMEGCGSNWWNAV
jgi:hypothetical protein